MQNSVEEALRNGKEFSADFRVVCSDGSAMDFVARTYAIRIPVGRFLATFKDFPPRQKAASFTVDQVMDKLKKGIAGRV
jgi:hypothetical protein